MSVIIIQIVIAILALINIGVGWNLNRKKRLAENIRTACYTSSLVQLACLCFVMFFRGETNFIFLMGNVVLFFSGYYIIAKPRFLKIKKVL